MFGGPPGPGWEWLQASIDRVPGMGKLKGVLGTAFQMAPNSLGAAARGHIVLIGTGAGIVAVLFHHGGYSFLWSLSAVLAAATFALCQLRGDSELQQLKLCIQGLFMVQVSVVGATLGAILGAIVAPLSLGIMRIAVGAAGGGGSRGQVREAQHGGPEHRALIELVDALGAIGAGQAGEGPAVNEAAAVHGAEGRRRHRRRRPTAAAA